MPKCRACHGRLRRDWPKRTNPVTGRPDYFHNRCYALFCERHLKPARPEQAPDLSGFWQQPDLDTARRYVDLRAENEPYEFREKC